MLGVLLAPVMTEKSNLALERGTYVFRVTQASTKLQVRSAVESLFSVKVAHVNILTRRGKKRAFRRREGTTKDSRRAYVRLEEGHTINFEGGF